MHEKVCMFVCMMSNEPLYENTLLVVTDVISTGKIDGHQLERRNCVFLPLLEIKDPGLKN